MSEETERKLRAAKPQESLVPSLLHTIGDKGATDLVVDAAEVALDQVVDAGLLQDVPVVGTVVKIGKIGVGIREHLFLKKLARFLRELAAVPERERVAFRARIQEEPDFCRELGEKVLLLVERADDFDKPRLIGKAFAAYLAGRVTYEQFNRMAAGIDRALTPDLNRLGQVTGPRIENAWGGNLLVSGLVSIYVGQPIGGTYIDYPLTEAGSLVRDICFQDRALPE